MKNYYDIAVIGAGASGLCAAISGAMEGCRVVMLEKQARVGKKILSTGNGRCNLSNENITCTHYHSGADFCFDIMKDFNAKNFFESLGLFCKSDSEGRIYPYSNSASSVLDALRLACKKLNVTELCDYCAENIALEDNIYRISSKNTDIFAKRVIVSCGGFLPDGSSYRIAKILGHTLTEIAPALCPVSCSDPVLKSLKGIRISGTASLFANNIKIKSEKGEIQFSDTSLSGICIFNLSRLVHENQKADLFISLDICPDHSISELILTLKNIKAIRKNALIEDFLTGLFPKRIGLAILKGITDAKKCGDITDAQIHKIAEKIKFWKFSVSPAASWKNAQVTAGGIKCDEINKTLESKIAKGVYFCGEIIDIDGDCGGFNLNWAWASGLYAAKNAADSIKQQ